MKRLTFAKVDEQMRRRSALLVAEVMRWPETRVRAMFGMQSIHRGDLIFALLPATRTLGDANAIMIKLHAVQDTQKPKRPEGEKWQNVPVTSDADLTAALERLDEAYRSVK